MAKSSQLLSVNVSLLKIGQNIGSREVATIPSAPQLRPGSRNSRCRAFGVGMGAPQGVQTRQSPVFPAPGRVFLKEIGMLATFISLLGSLAQAQIVWIGDVNTNFASQRVSNASNFQNGTVFLSNRNGGYWLLPLASFQGRFWPQNSGVA